MVAAATAGPELVTRLTITLWGSFVPLVIALYSVARYATYRGALAGAVVAVSATAVIMLRVPVIGTTEHTVELDVHDDGRGAGEPGPGTGHGLIGVRERATLYGGSLAAGPGPDCGFAVRMVLPADGVTP